MFAQQLLSNEVFPLKKSDTSEAALHFMQDWNVRNLPVIENGKLLGYVDENSLSDDNKKIETFLSTQEPIRLKPDTHLFEILKIMSDNLLSTVALVDNEENYIGCIVFDELMKHSFANSGLSQTGGIIVLEMNARNYSLAEIARISEVNGLKILHSQIESLSDSNNTILVSLKFNSFDLQYTLATFKRFNYIIYYSTYSEIDESQENRINWLLKYINT
ncbi:MAG: CBS domain-containing protein [Bacteroidetes bacterium]|nr:CBS domain-containing protein [Bacteroidota bacterium]